MCSEVFPLTQLSCAPLCQVWIMPYIEKSPMLCALYMEDEGRFWIRLWDPNDSIHQTVMCLIIDGAHRRHVSLEYALRFMRSLWLRPTTSVNELVCFLSAGWIYTQCVTGVFIYYLCSCLHHCILCTSNS